MQPLRLTGALLTLVGAVITASAAGADALRPPAAALDRLAWLGGCLEMRKGDLVVEEHRMRARGSTMLGMSRTTSSKGLVDYELTLIREQEGRLLYQAHPSGQPMAVFAAMAVTDDSVVFAAPEHDYPQIIGYRRVGPDSVIAWIDGRSGGRQRRIEFPYGRVACAGTQ